MSLVDTTLYNSLPSLEEAHVRRQTSHITHTINGPIRDTFLKFGAHSHFALYLSHSHHVLADDETLVKVQGSGHVMTERERWEITDMGNEMVPTTWMGGKKGGSEIMLQPMEFAVVPAIADPPSSALAPTPEFIDALTLVLTLYDCDGLFGIDTLAPSNWTEMSIGKASVVVKSNHNDDDYASSSSSSIGDDFYLPVAFQFNAHIPGFVVHGKCGKDHKHSSKPPQK